jgi:hypothetical protein
VELHKHWYTLEIFCQTGIFRGVFSKYIKIVGRISAAAIAGDIILFSLGGLVGDYTWAYTMIFRGIISQKEQRSCNGRSGGGGLGRGHYFFRVPNSLGGCDRWGEGRGILYFKASVVQWKDMRPWRPELGPEGKHFVSGNSRFFLGGGGAAKL